MHGGNWLAPTAGPHYASRITHYGSPSLAQRQPFRQPGREAGGHDLGLRGRNVVVQSPEFHRTFVHVVNDIRGFGIAVAWLPDAADVDEILPARLDFELRVGAASHHRIANERHRHVGMAKETDRRVLIGETGRGSQSVEHVAPALRTVERGVNDLETGDESDVFQFPEPLAVFLS